MSSPSPYQSHKLVKIVEQVADLKLIDML